MEVPLKWEEEIWDDLRYFLKSKNDVKIEIEESNGGIVKIIYSYSNGEKGSLRKEIYGELKYSR